MAFRHLETSFHRLHQSRFLDVQKTDYEFSGPFAYLKYYLNYFVQVALVKIQNAKNEYVWPFDALKNRFIDNQSRFLRRPEGRL
jgi:hypothetical protein